MSFHFAGVSMNAMAAAIHADNVAAGWWTDLTTGASLRTTRNRGELLCLVHSEVSEAVDGDDGRYDDHLPHRLMEEVEMADAAIRLFDIAGADNLDLDGAMEDIRIYGYVDIDLAYDTYIKLCIHRDLSRALEGYRKQRMHHVITHRTAVEVEIAAAMTRIIVYCKRRRFDLLAAIEEKRAYNKQRQDHKIETRRQAGGKAF